MKQKFTILLCVLLFSPILMIHGSANPTSKGFKQLNSVYVKATTILENVTSLDQMSNAIAQLSKVREQYANNTAIKSVLSITPENCPSKFTNDYQKSLALQLNMKDAAKRLAMAGILSSGVNGAAYKEFADTFSLTDNKEKEPLGYEGAPAETKEQRDARMQWWRDGKFGMFIHYGLFSALGGEVLGKEYHGCVEWIQMQSGLDRETYIAEAMPQFNPKSGYAEEWVKLAKEAGCTYTVLTTRHHEGYNMFDTKYTDFNIVKTKGIDIVDEYSKACLDNGMKAGYYVSTIDWNHPDYDPTGSGISYPQGNYDQVKAGKRTFGNHQKYKEYLHNIFDELTSNYPVDLIWWDFSQPNFQGDHAWDATKLMKTLFEKNPKAIQNNRLYHSDNHLSEGGIKVTPTWKGDYSTAEHHIPATGIDGDWEACQTLNGTWGYSKLNQSWRSSEVLIRELIDVVSRGGNFLLNIGPKADGSIPEETTVLFKEIGAWMNVNNEAIYGTRANPFDVEFAWGRVTRKGDNELYLLIYDKPESNMIELPCVFEGNVKATSLKDGQAIAVSQNNGTTSFDVSSVEMQPAATVIKIQGNHKSE